MHPNWMIRECTNNPYSRYYHGDPTTGRWGPIEKEKEKTMKFDKTQLSYLNESVRAFANNNGLTAETEYDTAHGDIFGITFRKSNGRVGKTYYIHANYNSFVMRELKEAFADVIRFWKLNENLAKPVAVYPGIKKVIFSNPVTVVLWDDGTKTVVRCTNEEFDPEKGLAMAIAKKTFGNNGSYFDVFKKWIKEEAHD